MENVYYNGSNPNTHLVRHSTTTTSTGLFDENIFNKTFHGDTVNVKDIDKAIDKTIKNVMNAEYGIYMATRTVRLLPAIEKVIFNPPATVVIWEDGVKTVVKCGEGEEFCEETGLAMAIARRYSGNRSKFLKMVRGAKHPEERE